MEDVFSRPDDRDSWPWRVWAELLDHVDGGELVAVLDMPAALAAAAVAGEADEDVGVA